MPQTTNVLLVETTTYSRVVPLPNGRTPWLINGGDPNCIPTTNWNDPPLKFWNDSPSSFPILMKIPSRAVNYLFILPIPILWWRVILTTFRCLPGEHWQVLNAGAVARSTLLGLHQLSAPRSIIADMADMAPPIISGVTWFSSCKWPKINAYLLLRQVIASFRRPKDGLICFSFVFQIHPRVACLFIEFWRIDDFLRGGVEFTHMIFDSFFIIRHTLCSHQRWSWKLVACGKAWRKDLKNQQKTVCFPRGGEAEASSLTN